MEPPINVAFRPRCNRRQSCGQPEVLSLAARGLRVGNAAQSSILTAQQRRRRMADKNSAAEKKHVYDESKIKTLSSLEHIRLRTGMYIGRIGDGSHYDDGGYILLKEVIDNAIDEYIMGHGKEVQITIEESTVSIRDYGRGIPLGKVIDCVSQINTGAKYNDDVFQFSVGLNGVGTKAVNALSKHFRVESFREGKFKRAIFSRGLKQMEKGGPEPKQRDGTLVEFSPDPEIFGEFDWNEELIEHRLRYYSFLNTGLTLVYNGRSFQSKGGLADLLVEELGEEPALYPVVHHKDKRLEF